MSFDYGGGSDANAIRFFKPIREDHDLQGEEFRIIPSCFEKTFGITLSNPIFLRLPNGAELRVSWTKRNNDILFQREDWKRFAQFCLLKHMDLLIFKYKGGSIFKVWIFDPCSTYQIIHSIRRTYVTTNRKGRTKESTSQRTKLGKRKINVGFDATQQRENSLSKYAGSSRGCSKAEGILKQKETALDRAKKIETNNPYFICTLCPTYIQRDVLAIPRDFSKEYLDGYEGTATIGVSEDSTRLVKIRINNHSNQSSIYNGWNPFCKENKLEVGDVCHFEKTEWAEVSFKITIVRARENHELQEEACTKYRKGKNQDKRLRRPIQNMERGKRKRSEGISMSCPKADVLEDSECPNMDMDKFKLFIKSIHLENGYPCIPLEFLKKHPRCHGKDVTLQVGEMLWPVKVVYYNYPNRAFGRFSEGWAKFARECKLKVGKFWEFDLIDEEKFVFKVSIP